jgi:iron complex transport system substrate-binding protein
VALVASSLVLATAARAGEVRDMLGRRVVVPERATRVVSLAPSATEIIYALGADGRLVGVTDYCDFPSDARKKPKIGGFYTPNLETILSLRPDLVLATSIEGSREETLQGIESLRVPVYVLRPADFASTIASVERVGQLLGVEAEARRLAGSMFGTAEAISRAVRGRRPPRVLYVLWGNPLLVPGRDTLITDLIQRAGGESVTAGERLAYPRLSVEEALARRPEVVVVGRHGRASIDQRLREWDHLALLPAVRQGRVHGIDGDLTHRPGPRIVEALRQLAAMFHPDLALRIPR